MVADPKSSAAVPAGRLAFGLTQRALWLLVAGILLVVPAFFLSRFVWAVAAWDVTVLLVALFDAWQLPKAKQTQLTRTWITAPALGNATEVELCVLQVGKQLLFCRVMDDLPAAFLETPEWRALTAYPGVPAKLRYTFVPRVRGDHTTGNLYLRYQIGRAHV